MRKTIMSVMLAMLLAPLAVSASDLETRPPANAYRLEASGAKFDTTLDYFIDAYSLSLTLPMYNDSLAGICRVELCTNVGGIVTIPFNFVGLTVDSAKDQVGDPCSYFVYMDTLFLDVGSKFASPGCYSINIYYRGGNFTKGFYHFSQGYDANTLHTTAYTMSEPQDARYWMPCVDEPWMKTTLGSSFYISVPDSYSVACNGLLVDTVRTGDTLTWHWQEDKKIATYLMSFAVSKYSFWADTAFTARGDTVPLSYYVWPEDSALATVVFDSVGQMMDCFTAKFGPYPFAKYGMAAVYPFAFGGMEHQDMTTIHRNWISGNAQRGIAHELAHMWWGDEVTCGRWQDIWLNEGFASYSEAIYDEHKTGKLPGAYMNQYFWKALRATGYPIYNPPPESLFAASMVYYKGAWVLQGLRWVMGDSTFFTALNAYGDSFSYGNAVTSDFQRIAEQHYGESLQWYFDQWVYRAGHPIYSTVTYYKTHGDSNSAWVKLMHTSNTGELYKMPLALACSTSSGLDSTVVIWDSLASQDFLVNEDQPITKVILDPGSWVLKEWDDYKPVLVTFLEPVKFDGSLNVPVWNKFWPDTNCAGYNVYRADSLSGPYARINQDILTDTVYFDNTTNYGQEYFYAVTAVSSIDTCYETHFSNILSHVATNGVEGKPFNGEPLTVDGLWQNSPNPFGRSTAINYQLAKSGQVNLKIFNLNGQLVKTLVSSEQPAGKYQVNWDGRNQMGQKVCSGIYVYCLKVGDRKFLKQMLFIR